MFVEILRERFAEMIRWLDCVFVRGNKYYIFDKACRYNDYAKIKKIVCEEDSDGLKFGEGYDDIRAKKIVEYALMDAWLNKNTELQKIILEHKIRINGTDYISYIGLYDLCLRVDNLEVFRKYFIQEMSYRYKCLMLEAKCFKIVKYCAKMNANFDRRIYVQVADPVYIVLVAKKRSSLKKIPDELFRELRKFISV